MPNCKACGADITWITTASGKPHPLQHGSKKKWTMGVDGKWRLVDVYSSHYDKCTMRVNEIAKGDGDV